MTDGRNAVVGQERVTLNNYKRLRPSRWQCPKCRAELPTETVHETWVEIPLGDGWMTAFRMLPQGTRTVVGEVRVFPRMTARAPQRALAGRWAVERSGYQVQVPEGGVTTRMLREVKVGEALRLLSETVRGVNEKKPPKTYSALLRIFEEHGFTKPLLTKPTRPGRRGRDDMEYARLADRYVGLLSEGERHPLARMAKEMHFSPSSLRDWVHEARRRGLLSTGRPGLAGGDLTPRARQLLGKELKP